MLTHTGTGAHAGHAQQGDGQEAAAHRGAAAAIDVRTRHDAQRLRRPCCCSRCVDELY